MELVIVFGKNVRVARLDLGWTQEQLAFESGIKRSYVSEMESGKRNPTLAVVEKLALALDVDASVLMESRSSEQQ